MQRAPDQADDRNNEASRNQTNFKLQGSSPVCGSIECVPFHVTLFAGFSLLLSLQDGDSSGPLCRAICFVHFHYYPSHLPHCGAWGLFAAFSLFLSVLVLDFASFSSATKFVTSQITACVIYGSWAFISCQKMCVFLY
ncbi:hypothetical protein DEU56DRAFT_93094 [Suillus clintonianus]|uniref:uncharacterized protein n=1 Tax=Suillus clintonianus TaxID=1904413 RepID=UPI001B87CE4D|nr:uncharacterized protein DEU56DRAFT_93094 [Suillus clintonianus]KAG2121749.1 hypothetical protein DEU56DRAFT_93094 [Suillus clintonianus]